MSRVELLVVGALGASLPCCATSASSPAAGVLAPCERDSDCAKGLSCQQGACSSSDGKGADASGDSGDANLTDGVVAE